MTTEAVLASHVVRHFEDLGYEVYHEVTGLCGRADIVAMMDGRSWIIECKTSFSLGVLEQGYRWTEHASANRVSIATPLKGCSHRQMRMLLAEKLGIGWIGVSGRQCKTIVKPKLHRALHPRHIGKWVREEHKTFAPAGTQGTYYSPFTATCKAILREVKLDPGLTLKEVIARVDHHYASESSAISSIRKWADAGSIRGVEVRRENRRIYLYPTEEKKV